MAEWEFLQSDAPAPIAPNPPLDIGHHYSRVTAGRKASGIKEFYKYFGIPGVGNLAGGLPNAAFFPYETLEAQIARPDRFKPTPNEPTPDDLVESLSSTHLKHGAGASSHLTVPHHLPDTTEPAQKLDLATALQYGQAQGYPPLFSFIRQFTREQLHPNVPYLDGPEVILSCGNTDGLAKVFDVFVNSWDKKHDPVEEREAILCEEFAFSNAIDSAKARGLQPVPVKIDLEGILPDGPGGLEDVLASWDVRKGKRPHLLYTVTIGQNPTGGTLSIQRRKELYAICSKYDVVIIEDDPYWYLQFPSAAILEAAARGLPPPAAPIAHAFPKTSGFPYLDSLVPSYLSFDTDGRVLRLDTFSKTVAPGCRLGWITGPPAVIDRILKITEASTQQPSGFVQSLIAELLIGPQPAAAKAAFAARNRTEQAAFTGWHVDGWVRWLEGLRGSYERRMNRMATILDAGRFQLTQRTPAPADRDWAVVHKTPMYSFDWPRGGMFLWLRLHAETHPLVGEVPGPRLARLFWVFLTQKPNRVLVSLGELFSPTEEIRRAKGWRYFRLCFAAEDEEEVDRASERLAKAASAFWAIKSKEELEAIDEESDDEVSEEPAGFSTGMGC